jgi:hypothetical protein
MAFGSGLKKFPQSGLILEMVNALPGKLCRVAEGHEGISFDGIFMRS